MFESASTHREAVVSTVPVLRLSKISKSFAGVLAVNGVDLDLWPGEVHAVLGANGAGKSTLMAIAAGVLRADAGSIEVDGVSLPAGESLAARAAGIAMVAQHRLLLDDLTVAENLMLGLPAGERPRYVQRRKWAKERLATVNHDVLRNVEPDTPVNELSLQQRQLLEIARALVTVPRVLILDEPTEPLDRAQAEQLFEQVQALTSAGVAVVYISHRLPEIRRIASRITVMREGTLQGTYPADVPDDVLVAAIVGKRTAVDAHARRERSGAGVIGLRLRDFQPAGFSQPIDLEVRAGEVVGLAGVAGNGQKTLLRAVAGLHPASGEVHVGDEPCRPGSPVAARNVGIVYVPGDRAQEGIISTFTVRENISVNTLGRLSRAGLVNRRAEIDVATRHMKALGIKAGSPESAIEQLSGGNQQKVLLARAIEEQPRVLLADEPTNGVDIGAREDIYRTLDAMAADGAAVVLLSTDTTELTRLCDRVLVLSRGHVEQELSGDALTEAGVDSASILTTKVRRDDSSAGGRFRWLFRAFTRERAVPAMLLAAIVVLALVAGQRNSTFYGAFNLNSLLKLIAVLGFVSLAQLLVVVQGGIDLSVGPLISVLVVVASFVMPDGAGVPRVVGGIAILAAVALVVGLVNAVLTSALRIPAVASTLATFIALQGVALWLRPTTGGTISQHLITALGTGAGFVPDSFILLVIVIVAGQLVLRRTGGGIAFRAVGSSEYVAGGLGAKPARIRLAAYSLSSLLCVPAALILAAQIGTGDPSVGSSYTLSSVAVIVLAGTSLSGGRGSCLAVLLAAVLLEEGINVTTFLKLNSAWQYWLVGAVTLCAATAYTLARRRGAAGARLT